MSGGVFEDPKPLTERRLSTEFNREVALSPDEWAEEMAVLMVAATEEDKGAMREQLEKLAADRNALVQVIWELQVAVFAGRSAIHD